MYFFLALTKYYKTIFLKYHSILPVQDLKKNHFQKKALLRYITKYNLFVRYVYLWKTSQVLIKRSLIKLYNSRLDNLIYSYQIYL